MVFEPDEHTCLHHYAWTRDRLADRHAGRRGQPRRDRHAGQLAARTADGHPGRDQHRRSSPPTTPATSSSSTPADSTRPSRLLRGTGDGPLEQIKSAPAFFDAENISVAQYFAASKDGTAIPYFVVRPARRRRARPHPAVAATADSRASNTPGVRRRAGPAVAGPRRHLRAGQHPRRRRVRARAGTPRRCARAGTRWPRTSPRWQPIWWTAASRRCAQLGAQGGSNGGLLMGIMLTKYPEKFGALVCQRAAAGHAALTTCCWPARRGWPSTATPTTRTTGSSSAEYSPYQNISATPPLPAGADHHVHPRRPGASRPCPQDDGGAGGRGPRVWYYENIEGGHAGAADNEQSRVQVGAELIRSCGGC